MWRVKSWLVWYKVFKWLRTLEYGCCCCWRRRHAAWSCHCGLWRACCTSRVWRWGQFGGALVTYWRPLQAPTGWRWRGPCGHKLWNGSVCDRCIQRDTNSFKMIFIKLSLSKLIILWNYHCIQILRQFLKTVIVLLL